MSALILLRHGQSTWNLENRFTGIMDVDLTLQGELEAMNAATLLRPYHIDIAYCSLLMRAAKTLEIILQKNSWTIPVIHDVSLNERDYGDLQGFDKTEMVSKYGPEQVLQWRRSYRATPPNGESLKDTFDRVIPFYKAEVEPGLQIGKTILIVAHGNSLRSLIMYLENLSEEEIAEVDIPTGIPKVYEFASNEKTTKIQNLF